MTIDLGLLIGLISIGLGLFLGLFFGLAGFRKGVTSELSSIKEAVIAIRTTVDKTWDLILLRFGESGGTVTRELENLGKIKITAEPRSNTTQYLIEIEKLVLKEGPLEKMFKEPEFVRREKELLGQEGTWTFLSPHRLRYELPSTNPKSCTDFVTFLLNWLNSTYIESLEDVKDFEEPVLT